jgi:hypothetical protein
VTRYTAAFTSAAPGSGAAYADLRAGSSDRVYLLECGLFATTAAAMTVELARHTTQGTTSTTVAGQPEDPGDAAASAVVGTAWSVAPASTAVPLRGFVSSANIGAGIIWTFGGKGLAVSVSTAIGLFARAAGAICRGYFVWDE